MTELRVISDLPALLKANTPLLDLRSPGEVAVSALPNATNIALLDNEQRAQVGTCYKQEGEQAALALGDQLISGEVKAQRLAAWDTWAKDNPNGVLYCWRGGLRSRLTQAALLSLGHDVPRVDGGYKALRHTLLAEMEQAPNANLGVVSGATGSGKTDVLLKLSHAIDLEGLARHKGSVFGQGIEEQPAQTSFENAVALELLQRDKSSRCWLEDEGRLIGRCCVPPTLQQAMQHYPRVEIEATEEERIDRLLRDYVVNRVVDYQDRYGDDYVRPYREAVLAQFARIKKRLGGLRHSELQSRIEAAFEAYETSRDPYEHRAWIATILTEYYDPMYNWQQSKREGEVEFRGDFQAVVEWCEASRSK
ncbi:MAG: tRNA 2-selenouridine(34) synthase MnmH [Pseudomonadales bacterium]|jgi:tRNA 2-selenouridine synthase